MVDTPRNGKAWHEQVAMGVLERACEVRVPSRMGQNPVYVRLSPAQSIERAEAVVKEGETAVSIHQAKGTRTELVATVSAGGVVPVGDWANTGVLERIVAKRRELPLRMACAT